MSTNGSLSRSQTHLGRSDGSAGAVGGIGAAYERYSGLVSAVVAAAEQTAPVMHPPQSTSTSPQQQPQGRGQQRHGEERSPGQGQRQTQRHGQGPGQDWEQRRERDARPEDRGRFHISELEEYADRPFYYTTEPTGQQEGGWYDSHTDEHSYEQDYYGRWDESPKQPAPQPRHHRTAGPAPAPAPASGSGRAPYTERSTSPDGKYRFERQAEAAWTEARGQPAPYPVTDYRSPGGRGGHDYRGYPPHATPEGGYDSRFDDPRARTVPRHAPGRIDAAPAPASRHAPAPPSTGPIPVSAPPSRPDMPASLRQPVAEDADVADLRAMLGDLRKELDRSVHEIATTAGPTAGPNRAAPPVPTGRPAQQQSQQPQGRPSAPEDAAGSSAPRRRPSVGPRSLLRGPASPASPSPAGAAFAEQAYHRPSVVESMTVRAQRRQLHAEESSVNAHVERMARSRDKQ